MWNNHMGQKLTFSVNIDHVIDKENQYYQSPRINKDSRLIPPRTTPFGRFHLGQLPTRKVPPRAAPFRKIPS